MLPHGPSFLLLVQGTSVVIKSCAGIRMLSESRLVCDSNIYMPQDRVTPLGNVLTFLLLLIANVFEAPLFAEPLLCTSDMCEKCSVLQLVLQPHQQKKE